MFPQSLRFHFRTPLVCIFVNHLNNVFILNSATNHFQNVETVLTNFINISIVVCEIREFDIEKSPQMAKVLPSVAVKLLVRLFNVECIPWYTFGPQSNVVKIHFGKRNQIKHKATEINWRLSNRSKLSVNHIFMLYKSNYFAKSQIHIKNVSFAVTIVKYIFRRGTEERNK